MADLAPTSNSVAKGTGAILAAGTPPIAGELIAAGNPYYVKLSDGKAYNCDANTATVNVPEASWGGIALNTAQIGQPVVGQTGGQIFLSCTTVKGKAYILSAAAGKICPIDDATAGTPVFNITVVGFGMDIAGTLLLHNFPTGIAL